MKEFLLLQEHGKIKFKFGKAERKFDTLEDIVLSLSKNSTNFIETNDGDQFQLVKAIKRTSCEFFFRLTGLSYIHLFFERCWHIWLRRMCECAWSSSAWKIASMFCSYIAYGIRQFGTHWWRHWEIDNPWTSVSGYFMSNIVFFYYFWKFGSCPRFFHADCHFTHDATCFCLLWPSSGCKIPFWPALSYPVCIWHFKLKF